MNKIIVTGMILNSIVYRDFDRIVTILTRERGKIVVFAHGVRKPHSSLIGRVNQFSYAKFEICKGRNSYTLIDVEIINYFFYFGKHLKETYLGLSFLEFMNYYTRENNDEYDNLKLLYCALIAISDERHNIDLIRSIFMWKYLVINGIYPSVNEICGLLQSTKYAFSYLISCNIKDTFKFGLKDVERKEFIKFVDEYFNKYHPYHNKAYDIYKMI